MASKSKMASERAEATGDRSPARKIVTRSPAREVGMINCKWFQDHPVEHESRLEKQFIRCSLLVLGLGEIKHQAFKMTLADDAKYTPDFELDLLDTRRIVVEVKIHSKIRKYVDVFNQAALQLRAAGWDLYIITEREIACAQQAAPVRQVLRYAKSELEPGALERVRHFVGKHRQVRCEEVLHQADVSMEYVLHLVARRELICTNEWITPDAWIEMPAAEDSLLGFERVFQVKPWCIQAAEPQRERKPRERLKKRPAQKGPYLRTRSPQALDSAGLTMIAGGLTLLRQPHEEPYAIRKVRSLAKKRAQQQGEGS